MPRPHYLRIADIGLMLDTDQVLPEDPHFLPFQTEPFEPDWTVCFRQTDTLPPVPDRVIHEDSCWRIHARSEEKYLQTWFDPPRDYEPYAVVDCDDSNRLIQVDYLAKGAHCVCQMKNSFSHLNWERLLILENRLGFHAAVVRTDLGGILFSGSSGIGKSTQAQLWCDHRNAVQINGDRPILSKDKDGWLAWGSPYAGSSRCHINESCPVSAIVMLRQAPVCTIRRLSPAWAVRSIWSGLTVHTWDDTFVTRAFDLATELATQVPVFEFACTPDELAVSFLEDCLRKEGVS